MKRTGNTGLNILLWVVTAFFVATFVVFVPHFASFIALVLAVLIVPIKQWQELLASFVNGKIKALIAVVLAVLTVATAPVDKLPDVDAPGENVVSMVDGTSEDTQPASMVTDPTEASETESTTEAATEPATEPSTESTTEPGAERPTESGGGAGAERPTESGTEPPTESTTEPETEPTTEATEDTGQDYVLNTHTMRFHYPSCGSVKQIKDENKAYFHGTREEAIAMGYKSCGNCHP